MFEWKSLVEQADELLEILRPDAVDREAAQKAANRLLDAARRSSIQELNDAVSRLATVVPDLKIGRAALLAIVCGALVELGASAEPVAAPVVTRFAEAVQQAVPFVEACTAEAALIASSNGEKAADLGAKQAVERFGQLVGERMPDAVQAFAALDWLSTAALAMLSRSKALRKQVRADHPLVQAIERLAALGSELPCFHEMLSILDDEQVVVLHPALGRGYVVRIAGIGYNSQLYTLLEDSLIGDTNEGWLPGERPSPEVAALAKDAPIADPDELPSAHGVFNLWNWTGLRSDGTLPTESQSAGKEHWIWIEGIPADIVPFEGRRVILIGPAPYPRGWGSGRFFPAMVGEFEVLGQLSAEEARIWLDRLASAPKPVPAGRYITADDIETIEF